MRPRTQQKLNRDLPKPRRIGNSTYVFVRRIEGHGERYRAHIPGKRGRSFLVHVLPRNKSSEDLIEVLRGIPHGDKDLPAIEDSLVQGSSIYVSLPWVPGRPLREFLEEGSQKPDSPHRLSVVEAVRFFNGFVHLLRRFNLTYRIVHGDLKPENLTVACNPSRLLMIDFGSAWVVERTTRRSPSDGIDFQYAAPELQMRNSQHPARHPQADFRSDQFSASVVFYEMLTFERPYDGAGGLAGHPDFREMYGEAPSPPSEKSPDRHRLHPRVWKAIDRAVLTGLRLDPDARFQSFDSWLNALKAIRVESDRAADMSPASKAALWVAGAIKRIGRPKH